MPHNIEVQAGKGGWWAILRKPGWRIDRGPYRFHWMARCAFPISRWYWPTPW